MSEVIPCLISKDDGKGNFVKAENARIEKVDQECANTLTCHEASFNVHHCNMVIVAMRGRNPDNPSDRTPGITTEQRLEPNSEGICNTLTTVQKDNLVLENIVIGGMQEHQSIKDDGICTTLTSSMGAGGGYVPMVVENKETIIYDDYNSNIPKNQDCIGTLTTNIGSSTMRNGIKIIEKQTEETIKIKQATSKGYIECKVGGVADFSFPDSKLRRGCVQGGGDICPTLMAGNSEIVKIEKVGQISNEGSQYGTVVSSDGLYPTISAGCHGYANPHILEKNAQEGDIIDAFNQKVLTDGISPTITTSPEGKKTAILPVVERYRIRKLIPRECFRLMNVEEEQFNRAEKVVSNSQLYKVAGNAIVVSVLCALFSQLGIQGKKKWNDMTEDERLQIVHKGTIFEKREENA